MKETQQQALSGSISSHDDRLEVEVEDQVNVLDQLRSTDIVAKPNHRKVAMAGSGGSIKHKRNGQLRPAAT